MTTRQALTGYKELNVSYHTAGCIVNNRVSLYYSNIN